MWNQACDNEQVTKRRAELVCTEPGQRLRCPQLPVGSWVSLLEPSTFRTSAVCVWVTRGLRPLEDLSSSPHQAILSPGTTGVLACVVLCCGVCSVSRYLAVPPALPTRGLCRPVSSPSCDNRKRLRHCWMPRGLTVQPTTENHCSCPAVSPLHTQSLAVTPSLWTHLDDFTSQNMCNHMRALLEKS